MSHNRRKTPSIKWGTAYAESITFGYPFINPMTYTAPREGSQFATTPSGHEDALLVGVDSYLTAEVKWIPTATIPAGMHGWDGSTGWKAMLKWARAKNALRLCPDATDTGTYVECYLTEPLEGPPTTEPDGTKSLTITLKATSGSLFTGY